MNKICIYSFYDKKGIVDNFVLDMLREMEKYVNQIFFVSNGEIDPKGKKKLKEISCIKIFERENSGFDITGIKESLIKIGFQKLRSYDELIIINSSIMGPIRSFKDMFDEMSLRDIDFWGMTTYSKEDYDPWGNSKYNYIPAHLQSYFLVIKKRMLSSLEFEQYWRKLPLIETYEDAVSKHEVIFAKHFEGLGYKWESYIKSQDLNHMCNYHLNYMPVELIKNRKCPVFKRKSLILDYRTYMSVTKGNEGRDLFNYLQAIGYNTDNIIENITRTANQMDIRFCLETNIFTGEKKVLGNKEEKSLALIFIIRSQEEWERLSEKIKNIKNSIDLYVYLDVDKKLHEKITEEIGNKDNIFLEKGRLNKFLDYLQFVSAKYELIGFFSLPEYNFKEQISEFLTLETGINSFIAGNMLLDEIIESFTKNKHMGLMIPSLPLHSQYEGFIRQWEKSIFDNVKKLLKHFKIEVDLNIEKPSLGPIGGSFIIKSKVFHSINLSSWAKFLNNNKDSLKIFLNSLPYMAQAAALLTYTAISLEERENYINQLFYLFLERKENQQNFYISQIYYELDGRITEKNISKGVIKKHPDSRIFEVGFLLEHETDRIRFDPIEYKGLYAKDIKAFINNKQVVINPVNGYRHGNSDLFITTDPQYDINYKFHKGDILKIAFKEFNVIFADELDIGFNGEKINSYGANINKAILDIKKYYEGEKFRNTAKKYLKKVKRKLKKH